VSDMVNAFFASQVGSLIVGILLGIATYRFIKLWRRWRVRDD